MQDHLQVFQSQAHRELAPTQFISLEQHRLRRVGLHDVVDLDDALDPVAVWLAGRQHVLDLVVAVEPSVRQIDANGLARADPALFDNVRLVALHHAGLGPDDQQPIDRARIAQRPQPVAVQPGDHPAPVGGGDRRRAVPRLHHRVAVREHVAMRLRHHRVLAGRSRDHQRLRHRRVAPAMHQQLEHVIQHRGIRAAGLDHRLDVLHERPKRFVGEPRLVAFHPVGVAGDGVDLAVMRERPERLRQPPRGKRVGRVALVVDREARHETRVEQIRVEVGQALGQEHALVDDRARRQRTEIQLLDLRRDRLLLDAPANHVQVAVELGIGHALGVPKHDLLDLGTRRVGFLADAGDVDRHLPPTVDAIAECENFRLDDLAAALLRAEVGLRQEHLADGDRAGHQHRPATLHRRGEKVLRDFDMDARAVAGLAIGVHRAAMPHRLQRIDAGLHNVAPLLAIQRGDEADAAGIVLLRRVVGVRERGPVGVPGGEEPGGAFAVCGHGCTPVLRLGREAASAIRAGRTWPWVVGVASLIPPPSPASAVAQGADGSVRQRRGRRGSPTPPARRRARCRRPRTRRAGWFRTSGG